MYNRARNFFECACARVCICFNEKNYEPTNKQKEERKDKKIKWKMGYYTPREVGETREGIFRRRLESITFNLTKERLPLP